MAVVGLAVGGWFASVIINKVANLITTGLENNWELHANAEGMHDQLVTALPQIEAVIERAERRPIPSRSLKVWLQQLNDVVYEAADVLDDLEAKNNPCDHLKGKNKVSALASSSINAVKDLIFTNEDLKSLQNVLKKLDRIAKGVGNFTKLLNKETKEAESRLTERQETSSFKTLGPFFGRGKEVETMLEMLKLPIPMKETGTSIRILPLVGVGGVGKTALAREIYNHADTFKVRLWVSVYGNNDVKTLIKTMIRNLVASPDTILVGSTLEAVKNILKDLLKEKRFLIVLDNVLWNDEDGIWDELHSVLTNGAEGSVVLVTTQSKTIAEKIGTVKPIVIDVLKDDDFLQLFEHHAFGDKRNAIGATELKKLQSIGGQIASKLHRLPLAGKAVGSLLQSNLNSPYWERFLKGEWWEFDRCLEAILPSLGLCFQHLSPNLKPCFAYCSLFPNGYVFEKDKLVEMWMAQGYIQPDKHGIRRMEDIGIEWFDELRSRSFFESTQDNKFVMNDLMRELAICVSLDECFLLKDQSREIPLNVRHLSLRTGRVDLLTKGMSKLKSVRTLLISSAHHSEEFAKALGCLFEKSSILRVLDLSRNRLEVKCLPETIGDLSRLRYFDLSHTDFKDLPKKITRLSRLQVLNLQGCRFSSLPEGICNLVRLRHLHADGDTLAHVRSIGKLTSLQELIEFRVKLEKGHRIVELEHLTELRGELQITNLENVATKEEAMKAMLIEKADLHSLALRWDPSVKQKSGGTSKEAILEGLKPHCNLKEIFIWGYGGCQWPTWTVECQSRSNIQFL